MNPFRKLHHRKRQMQAVRTIGIRVEHPGLVWDADEAIRKIEWFADVTPPAHADWMAGMIGPNGWGPLWDDIAKSAKFHRSFVMGKVA